MRTSLAYVVSMALHGAIFGMLAYAAALPEFLTAGFAVRAGDANGAVSQERHARRLEASFDTQLAATPAPATLNPTPVAVPAPPPTVAPMPVAMPVSPPTEPATAANLDNRPIVSKPVIQAPSPRTNRGAGRSTTVAQADIPREAPTPSAPLVAAPPAIETPLETSSEALSEIPAALPDRVALIDAPRGITTSAAAVTVQPLEPGNDDVDAIGVNSPQGARVSQMPSRLPRNREPVYPDELRRQQIGGTVMLRVTISAEGAAEDVTLAKTSGYPALDDSALEAVRTWRFEPARRNKVAVRYTVKLPITFSVRAK